MITTTDIANILYKHCQCFGLEVYQDGNIAKGEVEPQGRIVIHVKEQSEERIWKKCFVEVNLLTPDTSQGHADLIRLNELERQAVANLSGAGVQGGTIYKFGLSSVSILAAKEQRAHYVNARVLFKVINTINN